MRRLATNPVMLTCLCVVHWNEGRLPEGRSRVYRAVIRFLTTDDTGAPSFDPEVWNGFAGSGAPTPACRIPEQPQGDSG